VKEILKAEKRQSQRRNSKPKTKRQSTKEMMDQLDNVMFSDFFIQVQNMQSYNLTYTFLYKNWQVYGPIISCFWKGFL